MKTVFTAIGLCCSIGIVVILAFFPSAENSQKLPIVALLTLMAAFSLVRMGSEGTKPGKEAPRSAAENSRTTSPDAAT